MCKRTADVQSLDQMGKLKHFATSSECDGPKCLDEHTSLDDRVQRFVHVRTLERLGRFKLNTTRSKAEVS